MLSLALALVAGVGALGLWLAATRVLRENFSHYLLSAAQQAARYVDPELHDSLRYPWQHNGPEYQRAVADLRRLRETLPDVRYIYTVVRHADTVRFVLDAADPGDNDGDGIEDQARLGEIYEDTEPAMQIALGDGVTPGRPAVTDRPYPDKWGNFMTGWAPLLDAQGRQYGAVGVDVDAHIYLGLLARAHHWLLLGLVPAALLIALLAFGYHRIRWRALAAARDAASAARALDREQRRLGNIIEGIDLGTWETVYDEAIGPRTYVDARWAGMLGRRAEDLNPLTPDTLFPLLVHPDDRPVVMEAIGKTESGEAQMLEFDVRMRHADGSWIWTEVRGTVIERDSSGRPHRVVGTQMDVRGRKAIEFALIESESNFRSLFELSPLGICLAELPSGRFLKVNDALVAYTGYSRDELLGMTFWDVTPEIHHQVEKDHLAALSAGSHFGPYEKEYQRKDGTRFAVLVSGLLMRDSNGRDVGWAIVQDISKRKAMENELAAAARTDRLTGLANRGLFLEWLQAAIGRVRAGRQAGFAAMFLDFDRFKLVNDAMGHEAGDGLLCAIAARLRQTLGVPADCLDGEARHQVARFGGDEFLVLVNSPDATRNAQQFAEDLLAALARPYEVNGREVHSTASIGIVTSDQCLESAEAVIRNADVAMYEAKRLGRGCAVMFDDVMRARLTRYVTIDEELRGALESDAFSLVYQPIVCLETGRVTSVEALARWQHPTLGSISPSEFIPVAEESGLIVALGRRVLREACQAMAEWRALDPDGAPETVSVNVSRAELALGRRLLRKVSETLLETGLPPQCLRLEVTERDAMRDPVTTLELMRELRAMGVRLAMDDFGTGTSSLGCLRDYPFDVIKIDRSFVSDVTTSPDVLALVHAAITLAQNLGKTSVAEGIESAEQLAVLQSLGCQFGQGYYFSRPLTHDRMLKLLAAPLAAAAGSC